MKDFSSAYQAKKKAKKYSGGGVIQDDSMSDDDKNDLKNAHFMSENDQEDMEPKRSQAVSEDDRDKAWLDSADKEINGKGYAKGGMVDEEEEEASGYTGGEEDGDKEDDDIITRIMSRRSKMADGGEVEGDDEESADSKPNEFDYLEDNPAEEFSYDEKNSGDSLGNMRLDDDQKDIITRVMKSWAKKDKLPSPA